MIRIFKKIKTVFKTEMAYFEIERVQQTRSVSRNTFGEISHIR